MHLVRASQSSSDRVPRDALSAALLNLKMNVNHFSFSVSVSALTHHGYIGNSMARAVPFIQRSFEFGCES